MSQRSTEPTTGRRPEQVASERIRALRKRHGWTQQQLAGRLEELGSPLDRVAIAKLETGQRRLPLDEAFLFALALDVAPINLFVPLEDDARVNVASGAHAAIPSLELRNWVTGRARLAGQDLRTYFSEVPEQEFRVVYEKTGTVAAGPLTSGESEPAEPDAGAGD